MYICIYVYMYICIYLYMYICIYMHICIYVYMYICIYVYMYICLYVYICIYVYIYMYICINVHVYMYICIYVYFYIYIYICICICIYVYVYIYIYVYCGRLFSHGHSKAVPRGLVCHHSKGRERSPTCLTARAVVKLLTLALRSPSSRQISCTPPVLQLGQADPAEPSEEKALKDSPMPAEHIWANNQQKVSEKEKK